MFARMKEDIRCIMEQDPAARSIFEVIITYSGLHAVWFHRVTPIFPKNSGISR